MDITVENERERTTTKITFAGQTVLDLLRQLKINPETVLVVRNKEVITEEEFLNDHDQIQLLSVISGG